VQPRCSTVLFSDIGLQERLAFLSVRVLLVPVENSNHLPTHSYHSCVGEVERLKLKLKDLGSRLEQRFRYPVCLRKHFVTCCLLIIRMWLRHNYMYRFYQSFTRIPRFSGNGHTCTSSWYQATFSLPMWPGNEASMWHRPHWATHVSGDRLHLTLMAISTQIFTLEIIPKGNNFFWCKHTTLQC